MHIYLLWKGWWHGVGHHWWWRLLGLWWRRWLCGERERRMVHTILSRPLHGPKLWRPLEVLVTKAPRLVWWRTKIIVSITVTVIVSPKVATILGLVTTKGTLRPIAKPITVPVSVTTPTVVAVSPTPRIPIPAVILVATSTPSATTSSVFCHLNQFWVNGLVCFTQHRDEVAGLFHVVGGEKGVSSARSLTSGCTSNAMDIILRGVRVVIIDDKFHILHICESVAVWQNITRPHRILHTTTARSKEKR